MKILLVSIFIFIATNLAFADLPDIEALELSARVEAVEATETVSVRIKNLSTQYKQEGSELRFFSPNVMAESNKAFTLALKKNKRATEKSQEEALESVILAEKLFAFAQENKAQAEATYPEIAEFRQLLLELDAESAYPKEFTSVMKSLGAFLKKYEAGKTKGLTKKQATLESQLAALEIKALKTKWLEKPKKLLSLTEAAGGDKLATESYGHALKELKAARRFIENNPRNIVGIEEASAQATFQAKRAHMVAMEVRKINKTAASELESYVLEIFSLFERLGQYAEVDAQVYALMNMQEQTASIEKELSKAPEVQVVEACDTTKQVIPVCEVPATSTLPELNEVSEAVDLVEGTADKALSQEANEPAPIATEVENQTDLDEEQLATLTQGGEIIESNEVLADEAVVEVEAPEVLVDELSPDALAEESTANESLEADETTIVSEPLVEKTEPVEPEIVTTQVQKQAEAQISEKETAETDASQQVADEQPESEEALESATEVSDAQSEVPASDILASDSD